MRLFERMVEIPLKKRMPSQSEPPQYGADAQASALQKHLLAYWPRSLQIKQFLNQFGRLFRRRFPFQRQFIFDEPFMNYLIERGADEPYFVAWIENAEFMRPLSNEERFLVF
jgi:hypothetical protein